MRRFGLSPGTSPRTISVKDAARDCAQRSDQHAERALKLFAQESPGDAAAAAIRREFRQVDANQRYGLLITMQEIAGTPAHKKIIADLGQRFDIAISDVSNYGYDEHF